MAKCSFIKSDGINCRANATKSGLCFRHDPNNKEVGSIASSRGGENRRLQGNYGEAVQISTPSDAKRFLGLVVSKVWTGEVPVQVGSSMGFLIRCWLDTHEASEVEGKVEELERRLDKAGI